MNMNLFWVWGSCVRWEGNFAAFTDPWIQDASRRGHWEQVNLQQYVGLGTSIEMVLLCDQWKREVKGDEMTQNTEQIEAASKTSLLP